MGMLDKLKSVFGIFDIFLRMPRSWLKCMITDEEVDNPLSSRLKDCKSFSTLLLIPSVESWQSIKAGLQEGDEVWIFESSPSSWSLMCGRAGICILRKGRVIESHVIIMN